MKRLVLLIFLILVVNVAIYHCGTKLETEYNFPYILAKRIVLILSKFKPKTDDPIREIEWFASKLIKKSGLGALMNGKPTTNMAPIPYPVEIKFPTVDTAKFYFMYASAINCEGKLDDWSCYYCQLIGNNVQLVDYQYSFYFGTKSYVAINHDRQEIVLCYQGTINVAGGLVDARAVPAIAENEKMEIKIHKGFRDATRAHFDRDVKMIKGLIQKRPNYKLVVTGHSLGAAMASTALFMIKYLNLFPKTEVELYAYGLPRTGNKQFADFINQLNITAVRVVQGFDYTQHFMPAVLEYYHFQNQMWVNDNGKGGNEQVTFCKRDLYEDPNCSNSLGLSIISTFPPALKGGIDHLMYFSMDPSKCYLERPLEIIWRLFWPLNNYWPPKIYNQFPNFTIDTELFSEVRDFAYNGVKDLYKVASKPQTYYDPKYEANLNKIIP